MSSVRFGAYWGDPLLAERALARRLEGLRSARRIVLFGDEPCLGRLLDELSTSDLFGETRVIVVRRADGLVEEARLTQALRHGLPPDVALFFLGHDLRGPAVRMAQEARWFPPPTGRALRDLGAELLAEVGLPSPPFLVDLLAEASGGDTLRLAREVEKLALWQGKGLSRERLAQLLFFAYPTPYAFLDAVGKGEVPRALGELRRLLLAGWNAAALFFLLVGHVRALLVALGAREAGRPLPGPEWLARRRLSQAQRLGEPGLVALLASLQELDLRIKTGRVSPEAALHLVTLGLAQA